MVGLLIKIMRRNSIMTVKMAESHASSQTVIKAAESATGSSYRAHGSLETSFWKSHSGLYEVSPPRCITQCNFNKCSVTLCICRLLSMCICFINVASSRSLTSFRKTPFRVNFFLFVFLTMQTGNQAFFAHPSCLTSSFVCDICLRVLIS